MNGENIFCLRDKVFNKGTHIMGILNITPDSFFSPSRAGADIVARAKKMIDYGAEIIDIGGQSTRPGGTPISALEEMSRVLPAVESLRASLDVPISIDTFYPEVAEQAMELGADMINDTSCLFDIRIAEIVVEFGASICIMHDRRRSKSADMMNDKILSLSVAANKAIKAGISPERILMDGGIGFNRSKEEDWELLNHYDELKMLGYPLLLGTSRKSMFGGEVEDRLSATLESTRLAASMGVLFVRVHDVRENQLLLDSIK